VKTASSLSARSDGCKCRASFYTRRSINPGAKHMRVLARPAYKSLRSNPYTSIIYREVAKAGIRVVEYGPVLASLGHWDIIHVHWPESVFNHTLVEAIPTTEWLLFAIRQARRRGGKLLWTIHNLRAHERRHPVIEERFWSRFVRELDGVVALTAPGLEAARSRFPELARVPSWLVPHPHYRGQYPDLLSRRQAREHLEIPANARVLLTFGRMYEYKDVPALIRAVRAAPSERWIVLVVGLPRTAEIAEDLRRQADGDPRFRFYLRYVPSEEVQLFFRAADLVVEPYREILNSGTALLALSFDRPVLIPDRGAAVALDLDHGRQWVHSFSGILSAEVLASALSATESLPERTDGTHVACIDARRIGERMVRVYQDLVSQ